MFVLAAAALIAGCGDEDSSGRTTTSQSGGPLVVYERSGGIAFTAQRMVVQEDGSATVKVQGPGEIGAEFEVPDAELEELRGLLAEATFESPEPSGCADCYAYVLEHDGESASFDQANMSAGMEPLVSLLSEIVERETPSGPARDGGGAAS